MADIYSFPTPPPPAPRAMAASPGVLVAMRHVDLDEVVETVRYLRDCGRAHLLDDFNRRTPRLDRRDVAG